MSILKECTPEFINITKKACIGNLGYSESQAIIGISIVFFILLLFFIIQKVVIKRGD